VVAVGLRSAARTLAGPGLLAVVLVVTTPASGASADDGSVARIEEQARSLAAAGEPSAALQLLLRDAEARLRDGRGSHAVELMAVALELAPGSAAAHGLHGRALAAQMRFGSAAESLRRARELGDQSLRTLMYLAGASWENGDLAAAEELHREAVARSGGAPFALHQLGRLLLWQGRYADALTPLGQAAARTPAALDVRLDLARAQAGAGRDAEAADSYRAVALAQPDHPRAHYGLARVLARLGRAEEAARHLAIHQRLYLDEQRRAREAGLLGVELDAARAEVAGGRARAALERLGRLPETAEVLAARGAAHRAAGELGAAVAALERAVAAAPDREDLQALLRETRLVGLQPQ
jgi:tetratricopeptide (TPR) repeat protein